MHISSVLLEPLRELGATQFSVVLNIVSDRELRVYCDYPEQWQDRYFNQALFGEDPVFHAATTLDDAATWDEIAAPHPVGNVVDMARDYGLSHGISIPVEIGSDRHLVSITLDGVRNPTRSHRDALTRAARTLVATLADRHVDEVSRLQSRIYFLSSRGLGPVEIVNVIGQREDIHSALPRPFQAAPPGARC